jgi:hypothetical protein
VALAQLEEYEGLLRSMKEDEEESPKRADLVQQLRLRVRALLEDPALDEAQDLEYE